VTDAVTAAALLPPALAGAVLLAAAVLAGLFHRGRAALAALVLLWAWFVLVARAGLPGLPAPVAEVLAAVRLEAVLLLVPLELALLALLRETVVLSRTGAVVLVALVLQTAAGAAAPAALWDAVWSLERWPARALASSFTDRGVVAPGASAFVAAAGALVAALRGWRGAAPVLTGLAGALVASGALGYGVLIGATPWAALGLAGGALIAGVGWTGYRLAFLDALTGLPGRRMLDERLARLGRHWSVAMIDVDHFKQFNDTHGHDVGDQVLRMVAATLRSHFGSDAFRYGGEEFSVVFEGRRQASARERCDAFREDLAARTLVLRAADRPAEKPKGGRKGKASAGAKGAKGTTAAKGGKGGKGGKKASGRQSVGVTVSIGIASRTDAMRRPEVVLKAADVALYASKKGGRNRVTVHD
jgi:GGDEF domain-containing protein